MPDFEVAGKQDLLHAKAPVSAVPVSVADPAQPSFVAVSGLFGALSPLRRPEVADPLGGEKVPGPVVEALRQRRGQGNPVRRELAGPLEQHFGMDLSAVRVHADSGAGQIARSLQATAFTHGNDIYFAPGAYRPESAGGQRVLAHEMSHVVAQHTGVDRSGQGALRVGSAHDPAETAADRSADRAMAALRRTHVLQMSPIQVAVPTPTSSLRRISATTGVGWHVESVIRRYFEDWPASREDQARKDRFEVMVANAVAAGVSSAVAESAGLAALKRWGGWSHPQLEYFEHAWITGPTGFRTVLAEQLSQGGNADAVEALLVEVFNDHADQTLLARLGREAGFPAGGQDHGLDPNPEIGLNLDPEMDKETIEFFAERFDKNQKGHGNGFRVAWAHASDTEKERVLVILLGPEWRTTDDHVPTPHLADMTYLIEGVIGGSTPENSEKLENWLKDPRGSLFTFMRGAPHYQTKYMTEKERESYRLDIKDGRVFRNDGQPLVGDSIFVLSKDHVFYGGTKKSGRNKSEGPKPDAVHHSSFLAGAPVNCAGHFYTGSSGELKEISDQSGHYAPTDDEFGSFLYGLKHHHGVVLEAIKFRQGSAEDFLEVWESENLPPEQTLFLDEPASSPVNEGFDENDIYKNPFED